MAFGIWYLVFGIFKEDVQSLVNWGGYKIKNDSRGSGYKLIALRIHKRCREHLYTEFGILSLIAGFGLQLMAQLPGLDVLKNSEILVLFIILFIFFFMGCICLIYRHVERKYNALIEFMTRIDSSDLLWPAGLNLPANVSYREVEEAAEVFLKRELPFLSFGKKGEAALTRVWDEAHCRKNQSSYRGS